MPDSPELVTFFDGQDYTTQPRMFYVGEENSLPVLQEFCRTGTRSSAIQWELEDEVVKRIGDQGCFDDL